MTEARWLGASAPEDLAAGLTQRGYRVVGPRVEDGELLLGDIAPGEALPRGWSDRASPGRYRLESTSEGTTGAAERFGFRVGAHSWKRFLHPSEALLFRARRDRTDGLKLQPPPPPKTPLALLGVRPCDLAAIGVQDRVLSGGPHVDAGYVARRRGAFLVAVECTRPGATCFCASMGTGPGVESGYDVVLTELVDDTRHGFLARAGSDRGAELLAGLGGREATADEQAERAAAVEAAARNMGRKLEVHAARRALAEGAELRLWEDVAERCLACANCTLVCPTCFCTTVEDTTDLEGRVAERRRSWDSCFGLEFSYLHGGSVRQSVAARYRQWLTHKLSSWFDQFGEAGCVGCGRCIAWCPVGIDITEEAAVAITQQHEAAEVRPHRGPARRGRKR